MKKSLKITSTLLLIAAALIISSCAKEFTEPAATTGKTIAQVATESGNFDILVAALKKTNLASSLDNNNSGTFTVFAPTDVAFVAYFNSLGGTFATLDKAGVINWINTTLSTSTTPSISIITGVLNYHVVSSKIASTQIIGNQVFTTIQGGRLSISKQNSTVLLNANRAVQNSAGNGATVTSVDANASNGVIHTIDRVLIPISINNIWAGTSPNSAPVVNYPGFGVNYSINPVGILVFSTTTALTRNVPPGDGTLNVSTAAIGSLNDYNIISMAIARAELATLFITPSTPFPDFTVFAPTDAAFITYLAVADEAAARTAINSKTPAELAGILKYHVIPGRIVSTDLSNNQVVNTALTGKSFTIKIDANTSAITITDLKGNTTSTVISKDNLTNAGVIHRIDKVLESN